MRLVTMINKDNPPAVASKIMQSSAIYTPHCLHDLAVEIVQSRRLRAGPYAPRLRPETLTFSF